MNEIVIYLMLFLTIALVILTVGVSDGMEICQQTQSFDTCYYALH